MSLNLLIMTVDLHMLVWIEYSNTLTYLVIICRIVNNLYFYQFVGLDNFAELVLSQNESRLNGM